MFSVTVNTNLHLANIDTDINITSFLYVHLKRRFGDFLVAT